MSKEEQSGGKERITTGVSGLDRVLHGGLFPGSVHILEGPPGSGKTILANQICYHHVDRYGPALYVTLLAESHDALLQHLRSMSFYRPEVIPERLAYLSAFDVLVKDGLRGVLSLLRTSTRQQRASFVVLDGLFVLEESIGSDPEFRKFINELATLAKLMGTTILLLTNSCHRDGGVHPEYTMVDGWIELARSLKDYRTSRTLVVHKFRGSDHLSGAHQVKITDRGIVVLPRLESVHGQAPAPRRTDTRLTTGVAELDGMLRGGLPQASATAVLGPSGIGKTLLGLHFVGACTPEEPGLIFTFNESADELLAAGDRLGLNLSGKVADGSLEVIWAGWPEELVDDLGHRLLERVADRGVRRLLVDGLEGFHQALFRPDRLRAFLVALGQELKRRGVTVCYTAETPGLLGGEQPVSEPLVSALADNLVHLRYGRDPHALQRTLAVVKVRQSGFDTNVRQYEIRDDGFDIGGPSDEA